MLYGMTNPREAREFTRVREDGLERIVTDLRNAHKTKELDLASGLQFVFVGRFEPLRHPRGGMTHVQHHSATPHRTLSH